MRVYLLRDSTGHISISNINGWHKIKSLYNMKQSEKIVEMTDSLYRALIDNLFLSRTQAYLRELWNEN